ncbi:MAG: heparan-alpha-glucosaminide N-acetyltransferase domain-containing protein [Candidatus Falkowbacteria bacterium]|nr:heparan-alpha-glucosaminide N-acetyltransferase domain-containing protein [Candidatus Falkowbacteria bacterium]
MNKGSRNIEFDIARGVAIFLMIFQHVWLIIFSGLVKNKIFENIAFFSGTVLVAPVFLFLMGASLTYSRRNSACDLCRRGFQLIILGYALSALRFFLPLLLCRYLGLITNPEDVIYKFPLINYLLEVDILQVAGLSLLGIAFLKWRQIKMSNYLIIAFVVALVSPVLSQINLSSSVFFYLLSPFFGADRYVVFPFFPWFVYSLVGFYFGSLLKSTENVREFYSSLGVKMVPLILLGSFFLFIGYDFQELSYTHHGIGPSLLFIVAVIYWLGIIHFNYHRLSPKIISTLTLWSKYVTPIYVVQWLLIAWTAILINIK